MKFNIIHTLTLTYFPLSIILPLSIKAVTITQENNTISLLSTLWTRDFRENIPPAVRFGFHTCFERGCNGCIDFDNEANAGLEKIYQLLNDIYDNKMTLYPKENYVIPKNDFKMSRADFWALSAWHAATTAFPDNAECLSIAKQEKFKFKYGRKDCSTSPKADYPKINFPNEKLGVEEILRSFGPNSIFNLTEDECVALISGGHSLGRAHLDASGYEGPWNRSPETLDNNFIESLVKDIWKQRKNPHSEKNLYQYYVEYRDYKSDPTVGLNTDISLLKNITLVDSNLTTIGTNNGQITQECERINHNQDICGESIFAVRSKYYAENKDAILVQDFADVYDKLLKTTLGDLDLEVASESGSNMLRAGWMFFGILNFYFYILG